LPEDSKALELLRAQLSVTLEGLEAFSAWAAGEAEAAERVRDAEHRADSAKRDVVDAVRSAFVLPVEPEDLFTLSQGVDSILNHARDVVRESEVLEFPPDDGIARMAALLVEAVRHLDDAIHHLAADADAATKAADEAIRTERRLERSYFDGMAALLEVREMRERVSRRELYRRCAQIGETVVDVAERVVYAVVKES
jgi:uncharacterized protein Yka (UPF0111/DUF47 family)